MRYAETVALKGGAELLVRNAVASDARALRETMRRTHSETDYRANPRSANRAGYYDNGEQFRTGNYQSLPVSVA